MTGASVAYPYRYDRTATASSLADRFASLAAGDEVPEDVRVAGRLRTMRRHGQVAFADLVDSSGRIQLLAQQDVLGDDGMARFIELNVGDIVGVQGTIARTRRGELSIKVTEVGLLAKCLRPMPEKWHGVTDVETRYRHRYLDLIVNPDARRTVEARAAANRTIRDFLDDRGFVEVETPLLQPIAGGAVARPFVTHHNALDIDLYLRVAPELYLKRLLIGGMEKVYELNRSFRNEGVSATHNPEYTMLEAYEAYVDYEDTMTLVESLVRAVAGAFGSLQIQVDGGVLDLEAPFRRVTMFEAIEETAGEDVEASWRAGDADALRRTADDLGVKVQPDASAGHIMLEIFEQLVERTIMQPTFVKGFPQEVSPLAKEHRDIPGFTEHADLVIAGIEIAPIFSELNDPVEQERRFRQQAAARAAGDEDAQLPDAPFVEALSYGMPPAGGFGLGVDRLLMILLGFGSIREAILFPTLRPEA